MDQCGLVNYLRLQDLRPLGFSSQDVMRHLRTYKAETIVIVLSIML